MAIGERIRFFRNLKGMTQKFLGVKVGFPEKTADIRLAQYESGTRTPKSDLTEALADALGVSTMALNVPDIEPVYALAKKSGYKFLESDEIVDLPFWDKGIRYFLIEGPNKEAVEFLQKL